MTRLIRAIEADLNVQLKPWHFFAAAIGCVVAYVFVLFYVVLGTPQ